MAGSPRIRRPSRLETPARGQGRDRLQPRVDRRLFPSHVDRLAEADGVALGAIFGPQHGFRSDVQDNMIETPHREDAARQVPVYSLYSETREPTAEMLRGLDALVIDLQDIGARIAGSDVLRTQIESGMPIHDIADSWKDDEAAFNRLRARFLLY